MPLDPAYHAPLAAAEIMRMTIFFNFVEFKILEPVLISCCFKTGFLTNNTMHYSPNEIFPPYHTSTMQGKSSVLQNRFSVSKLGYVLFIACLKSEKNTLLYRST